MSKSPYVFSWEHVPGKEEDALKTFLLRKLVNAQWIEGSVIAKVKDSIFVTHGSRSLSMVVNRTEAKLLVDYDDATKRRTHELLQEGVGNEMRFFGMLEEMEVIEAVRSFLEIERNFKIDHVVKSTTEHGADITATSPREKVTIKVEAKGQTSSTKSTKRYGKEFDENQKEDHLGRALLKCLAYLDADFAAGIALPADKYDQHLVNSIRKSLGKIGLTSFLVDQNYRVRSAGELPL